MNRIDTPMADYQNRPNGGDGWLRILRFVPEAGELRVLDGNSAVAMTEAALAESAALGASFPADTATLAWRAEQTRYAANLLGSPLSNLGGEGPRAQKRSVL